MDSQSNGTLSHVNLMPADGGVAFAPEQRAIERHWQMVYVGIHDHAQGVRTVLVVPMWYDERTKFSGSPGLDFGDTLSEATTHPEWAWDEAGTTDIKFHLQDEVFYLDEVSRPADNASDPNR
ncbi:MAG: hypothetical protein U1E26_11455 [Coriobacteriia bacterium]|nr:hypothetical protein [Coriobacteriia bacterium]